MHRFQLDASGNLLHFVNDALRATVPPDGQTQYAESWPEAGRFLDDNKPAAPAAEPER